MKNILDQIRLFATDAHAGQTRKYSPEPYIVHPVRVMETLAAAGMPLPMLAAALLHDVVEDTPVTAEELSDFLFSVMEQSDAAETFQLVIALTDVYVKPAYPQWNRRKRKDMELQRVAQTSPHAQTIKYADIFDNVHEITSTDPDFAPRYLRECLAILQKIDKGNSALRKLAVDAVQAGLDSLAKQP